MTAPLDAYEQLLRLSEKAYDIGYKFSFTPSDRFKIINRETGEVVARANTPNEIQEWLNDQSTH